MSSDPAMADGLNWYRYANNNPIMYMDPTGMWIDNDDGTHTAEEGDTLHGLYGDNWREESGWGDNGRDPKTLQVVETVGKKRDSNSNSGEDRQSNNTNTQESTRPYIPNDSRNDPPKEHGNNLGQPINPSHNEFMYRAQLLGSALYFTAKALLKVAAFLATLAAGAALVELGVAGANPIAIFAGLMMMITGYLQFFKDVFDLDLEFKNEEYGIEDLLDILSALVALAIEYVKILLPSELVIMFETAEGIIRSTITKINQRKQETNNAN